MFRTWRLTRNWQELSLVESDRKLRIGLKNQTEKSDKDRGEDPDSVGYGRNGGASKADGWKISDMIQSRR